jgi:cell wall-associated NlpC family hydrolase
MTSDREQLALEARSWLGTPYHHHGRVKGVGVDCAMLLAEVFERCGLIDRPEPGFYPVDWHEHRREELFIGWIESCGARETESPAVGDVAVFRFGRTYSHGAIVVAPDLQMVHALIGRGVVLVRPTEAPLQGRACRFYTVFGQAG